LKRTATLIVSVAAAIILSKLLVENVLGVQLEPLVTSWMADAGAGGAITVVGLLAADLFLPIPSSVVMVLSGAAFGVVWGGLFSLAGSIGGEWLGFELARRYGRRGSAHLADDAEVERLSRIFARHGAAAVAVTRALPVVMETMSVVAGLSGMARARFLAASLVGTLPIVFVYAYAGAVSRQAGSLVPGIVMLIAVAGLGWIVYRARVAEG
jgi:uncharacterized membrane protein YdjX (TVP38/TMEM64 family)